MQRIQQPETRDFLKEITPIVPDIHSFRMSPGILSNLPLYDAQAIILLQLKSFDGLQGDRRQILESALYATTHLSDTFEDSLQDSRDEELNEEQYKIPSVELLTWMLRGKAIWIFSRLCIELITNSIETDIKGNKFGPFVKDYFRYISEASVKGMCLSLLHTGRLGSAESAIYTVCVNSMVYKFLTCVINTETDTDLASELRHNALQYRSTAKAALQRIPLVTSSSLKLLQAILSGVRYMKLLYQMTLLTWHRYSSTRELVMSTFAASLPELPVGSALILVSIPS